MLLLFLSLFLLLIRPYLPGFSRYTVYYVFFQNKIISSFVLCILDPPTPKKTLWYADMIWYQSEKWLELKMTISSHSWPVGLCPKPDALTHTISALRHRWLTQIDNSCHFSNGADWTSAPFTVFASPVHVAQCCWTSGQFEHKMINRCVLKLPQWKK